MEQDVNLKDIEGKAYRSIRQDGLDSVIEGVSLAFMALFLYDRRHGWAFVLGAGLQSWYLLQVAIRKRFTYPRTGHAKFQLPRRGAGLMRAIAGMVFMAILGILRIIVSELEAQGNMGFSVGWILPVYAGLLMASLAFAAAHRYGSALDYIFAALFLESIFVGFVLIILGIHVGKATAYQLWGLTTILVLVGLVQFIRFLRKYPKASGGVSDDQRE